MSDHVHCKVCGRPISICEALYLDYRRDKGAPSRLGPYCAGDAEDIVAYITGLEGSKMKPIPAGRPGG